MYNLQKAPRGKEKSTHRGAAQLPANSIVGDQVFGRRGRHRRAVARTSQQYRHRVERATGDSGRGARRRRTASGDGERDRAMRCYSSSPRFATNAQ